MVNSNGFDHNSPLNSNGFDHNAPPSLLSMVQPEQGTSYSDGFYNKPSSLNYSGLETSEQEEAFVNSLLADQGEFSGERGMNTLHHDFNPTIPLSRRYVQDSRDADSKIYEQVKKFIPLTIGEYTPIAHKPQKFISITIDIITMLSLLSRS